MSRVWLNGYNKTAQKILKFFGTITNKKVIVGLPKDLENFSPGVLE
jgi:RNase H-fold protein (predicted Holliday junction resolvase)